MRPFLGHSLQDKKVLPDGPEWHFFTLLIAQKAKVES